MSSITYTRGRDWWISRTTPKGNARYPRMIEVGSLDKPRIYIPAKTKCPHCGEKLGGDDHE